MDPVPAPSWVLLVYKGSTRTRRRSSACGANSSGWSAAVHRHPSGVAPHCSPPLDARTVTVAGRRDQRTGRRRSSPWQSLAAQWAK